VPKIDRFTYRIEVILGDEQSRAVRRCASAGSSCEGQFYAGALSTAAFFADLGSGGEVNVQREEKKEQQRCNSDDPSSFARFGGKRR
jgi:hypothetical protein